MPLQYLPLQIIRYVLACSPWAMPDAIYCVRRGFDGADDDRGWTARMRTWFAAVPSAADLGSKFILFTTLWYQQPLFLAYAYVHYATTLLACREASWGPSTRYRRARWLVSRIWYLFDAFCRWVWRGINICCHWPLDWPSVFGFQQTRTVSGRGLGVVHLLLALSVVPPFVLSSFVTGLLVMLALLVAACTVVTVDFLIWVVAHVHMQLLPHAGLRSAVDGGWRRFSAMLFGKQSAPTLILVFTSTSRVTVPAKMYFTIAVLLALLSPVDAAETDAVGARLPRFDDQRSSYRTWLLAFSAYISLRYPDLVGIVDGTRLPPPPEAGAEERSAYLKHNRQVYGAIAQAVPDWLVNTLYMSHPNDGQASLAHLRAEYGVSTPMRRWIAPMP